jgi:hypothetical protein
VSTGTYFQKFKTALEFPDEPSACARFDELAERSGCFKIYREISGCYVQPRMATEDREPKIDRILIPTQRLIEAGWPHGPIGVECKASGKDLGPILAQAQDYSRAVFYLPHGFKVMLDWIFIWPCEMVLGDLASVMAQSRIGNVTTTNWLDLKFQCAGSNAIVCHRDGSVEAKGLKCGRKRGTR